MREPEVVANCKANEKDVIDVVSFELLRLCWIPVEEQDHQSRLLDNDEQENDLKKSQLLIVRLKMQRKNA